MFAHEFALTPQGDIDTGNCSSRLRHVSGSAGGFARSRVQRRFETTCFDRQDAGLAPRALLPDFQPETTGHLIL
jgi:hypothetical protein